MNDFSKVTTDKYGRIYSIGQGYKLCKYPQVNNLKDAAKMFFRSIMKLPESEPIMVDGKVNTILTLQKWVNDYGVVLFENMDNDGYEYTESIVCVEDVVNHLINTYGWISINRTGIPNQLANEVLNEVAHEWGIKDYDRTA